MRSLWIFSRWVLVLREVDLDNGLRWGTVTSGGLTVSWMGLFCIVGRLQLSDPSVKAKQQVMFGNRYVITELIFSRHHKVKVLAWASQVLAVIMRHFWVLHGLSAFIRVIGRCPRRIGAVMHTATASQPFECAVLAEHDHVFVRIDVPEPLHTKRGSHGGRRHGCCFACHNIWAVCIKIMHLTSTDAFTLVLIGFVARSWQSNTVMCNSANNVKSAYGKFCTCTRKFSLAKMGKHLSERDKVDFLTSWHEPLELSLRKYDSICSKVSAYRLTPSATDRWNSTAFLYRGWRNIER